MRRARALQHLESFAEKCAATAAGAAIPSMLRVEQLWLAGALLDADAEPEAVEVVLVAHVPAAELAWLDEPPGATHWANATRLSQLPLRAWWRSHEVPVWNHRILRPLLLWDASEGVRRAALEALRTGHADALRLAAPSGAEALARLRAELAVAEAAVAAATVDYAERRWAPGRLERVADPLWRRTSGYLDVLHALREHEEVSS